MEVHTQVATLEEEKKTEKQKKVQTCFLFQTNQCEKVKRVTLIWTVLTTDIPWRCNDITR